MKIVALVLALLCVGVSANVRPWTPPAADSNIIPNEYIVVFQKHLSPSARLRHMNSLGIQNVGQVAEEWNINDGEFQAYHLRDVDVNSALSIQEMPEVQYIEPAQNFRIIGDDFACIRDQARSWGLARTVTPNLPIDNVQFEYDDGACGQGVDLYIMDTGIQITHQDFSGRARWGRDFTGEGENDRHGHGTHVASTAGGSQYGLARCANIVAVKVCNGGGSCPSNAILSGVQFTADAARQGGRKVVGNMSLGGGFSQASNDAVNAAVTSGALVVVAAGNSNAASCRYSPASAENAFTAMSSDRTDQRSSFSNYDECSNIFAPGSDITAAWIGTDTATRTISGTSMASPHVAGVSAAYWSKHPSLNPFQLRDRVVENGVKNVIKNPGQGSPNVLLQLNCNTP